VRTVEGTRITEVDVTLQSPTTVAPGPGEQQSEEGAA
jgi:hypothetical protein